MLRNTLLSGLLIAIALSSVTITHLKDDKGLNIDYLPKPNKLLTTAKIKSYPQLRGIVVDKDDPFSLEFIIDTHGASDLSKKDKLRLLRYFIAGLSIPAKDWWVNLDPDEGHRILAESVEFTEFGRTLLEEDYVLKQLSSSLTHPDTPLGRAYWNSLAHETHIENRETANKVWVVPGDVVVAQDGLTAYIEEQTLEVRSEDLTPAFVNNVLPEIQSQVNGGQNFAKLRQVYSALILASWFKKTMFNSIYNSYLDSKKIHGIDVENPEIKKAVFKRYVQAYEKGVYNIKKKIKQGQNEGSYRTYFSGGKDFVNLPNKIVYVNSSSSMNKQDQHIEVNLRPNDSFSNISDYIRIIKKFNKQLGQDNLSKTQRKEIEKLRLQQAILMIKGSIPNKTMASIVVTYLESNLESETKTWLLTGVNIKQIFTWITQIGTMLDVSSGENLLALLKDGKMNDNIAFDSSKAEKIEDLFKRYSNFYTVREYEEYQKQFDIEPELIKNRLANSRSTGNTNWHINDKANAKHRRHLNKTLKELEAKKLTFEEELKEMLLLSESAKKATVSTRVKTQESIWKKLDVLKQKEDPNASLANVLDLLGGRISVDGLVDLESTMELVEVYFGDRVISKRSKFIEYDNTEQQFRSVNYTIDIGDGHVAELQLKTVAMSFISDLEHDIVYKKHLLSLPGSLRETVVQYFRNSNVKEMEDYINAKRLIVGYDELDRAAEDVVGVSVYNDNNLPKVAVDNRQFNMFYEVFLEKLLSTIPLEDEQKDTLVYAVDQLKNDYFEALKYDQEAILGLCRIVHDNGYLYNLNNESFEDSGNPEAGAILSPAAFEILKNKGVQGEYVRRYSRPLEIAGEQRLRVKDLGIDKLSKEERIDFFKALGKNISKPEIRSIIDFPKANLNVTILNVLNEKFDILLDRAKDMPSKQKAKWIKYVIGKQLSEVALATMLSDIDGKNGRNLSYIVFKSSDGSTYTYQDMLAFYFYIAQRPWHRYAGASFSEFVIKSTVAERGKIVLGTYKAITTQIAAIKLRHLASDLLLPKKIAKKRFKHNLQQRTELLKRFFRSQARDKKELDIIFARIDKTYNDVMLRIKRSNSDYLSDSFIKKMREIVSQDYNSMLVSANPNINQILMGNTSSSAVYTADGYGGIALESINIELTSPINSLDQAYSRYYFSSIGGLVPELVQPDKN